MCPGYILKESIYEQHVSEKSLFQVNLDCFTDSHFLQWHTLVQINVIGARKDIFIFWLVFLKGSVVGVFDTANISCSQSLRSWSLPNSNGPKIIEDLIFQSPLIFWGDWAIQVAYGLLGYLRQKYYVGFENVSSVSMKTRCVKHSPGGNPQVYWFFINFPLNNYFEDKTNKKLGVIV